MHRVNINSRLDLLTVTSETDRPRPFMFNRRGWRLTATAALRREARSAGRPVKATVCYGITGGTWGTLRVKA